jgi:hypothetical protein
MVDDFALAFHIVRLEVGSRIRNFDLVVDLETVTGASLRVGHIELEPAIALTHRLRPVEHQLHPFGPRCP